MPVELVQPRPCTVLLEAEKLKEENTILPYSHIQYKKNVIHSFTNQIIFPIELPNRQTYDPQCSDTSKSETNPAKSCLIQPQVTWPNIQNRTFAHE